MQLDDRLLEQAEKEAHRQGLALPALIERGLRLVLARPYARPQRRRVRLPVCRAGGGTLPGIDLNDTSSLLDLMEGRW